MSGVKQSKCRAIDLSYLCSTIGIKSKEARHAYVPHYESLTIKKILLFLEDCRKYVFDFLPDLKELDKISREWICNVCCTVLEEEFTEWVTKQVNERNEEVKEKGELNIDMDPEIFAAFQASTSVSRKYLISPWS